MRPDALVRAGGPEKEILGGASAPDGMAADPAPAPSAIQGQGLVLPVQASAPGESTPWFAIPSSRREMALGQRPAVRIRET